MHKNFSLKFKVFDIFVILITIIGSLGLIFGVMLSNNGEERVVRIYHNNKLIENHQVDLKTLTSEKDIVLTKVEYPDLLGDFTIEVSPKKGVRVHDITCYDHTCEKQGWINVPNLAIICIPNDIRIVIETSSGGSGDIWLGTRCVGGFIYEKK